MKEPRDERPAVFVHEDEEKPRGERPLGDILSDLSGEFSDLVRQEITLAKVELSQKASRTAKDSVLIAVGSFLSYAGLLALIAAAIIGLAEVMAWWLSALIVGAVVLIIGYILIQKGSSDLKKGALVPKETIESLKEDKDWAKEQMK